MSLDGTEVAGNVYVAENVCNGLDPHGAQQVNGVSVDSGTPAAGSQKNTSGVHSSESSGKGLRGRENDILYKKLNELQEQIRPLCEEVAAYSLKELKPTNTMVHVISMLNNIPIRQKLRKIPHHKRDEFCRLLTEMVADKTDKTEFFFLRFTR